MPWATPRRMLPGRAADVRRCVLTNRWLPAALALLLLLSCSFSSAHSTTVEHDFHIVHNVDNRSKTLFWYRDMFIFVYWILKLVRENVERQEEDCCVICVCWMHSWGRLSLTFAHLLFPVILCIYIFMRSKCTYLNYYQNWVMLSVSYKPTHTHVVHVNVNSF